MTIKKWIKWSTIWWVEKNPKKMLPNLSNLCFNMLEAICWNIPVIIMLIWYILIAIRAKKNRDFIYSCSQWKLSSKYNPLEESVVYWLIKKQRIIKWECNSQSWLRYISMERAWLIILIYCKRDIYKDFIFKRLYHLRFIKNSEIDVFKWDLIKYNKENNCNAKGIIITNWFTTKNARGYAESLWVELRDIRRWWKKIKNF